jgi:hypothetical protein
MSINNGAASLPARPRYAHILLSEIL